MPYYYSRLWLVLASDLACPELLQVEPAAPDIVFRLGEVPESLENPANSGARWQTAPGIYLLNLVRVARFLVRDGREISIQPRPGVERIGFARFCSVPASPSCFTSAPSLLFIAAASTPKSGAVLFSGNSGMGKSTLVSAFLERGYKILADDMLALTFNEQGRVMALPDFPQVKLWADLARALGRSTEGLRRVTPEVERFVAPEVERFDPTPTPLRAIYFLRTHNKPEFLLEPLGHTPRFNALLDNTWQKLTLPGLGLREWHFLTGARIASLVYAATSPAPTNHWMSSRRPTLLRRICASSIHWREQDLLARFLPQVRKHLGSGVPHQLPQA